MRAYPHYRDSGVEWLGEVPEHWGAARVTDMFEARSGGTPSTAEEAYWEGDIPWVSAKDMKVLRIKDTEDHISDEAVRASATSLVPRGTVLLVARSGILKRTLPVGLSEREVAINQDIKGLIPREGLVEPLYFVYCLNGFQSVLLTLWRQQGATVESLDFDTVRSTSLPLPPLDEQRAIAAYLDRETERIDALVAKKRLLIERLEEYRTALITRTVTLGLPPEAARAAGLDPSPRLKPSGVEWLGEVPEHWEVKELKRCVPGVTVGIVVTPAKYYEDEGVPCLRSLNVLPGKLTATDLVHISEESNRLHRKSMIFQHDIVVVRSGRPGSAAVVDGRFDGANAIDLIIIRQSDQIRSDFLVYTFESELISRQIALGREGSVQEHFNIESTRELAVVVPPLEEQRRIVDHLDTELSALQQGTASVQLAIERLQEYRTALITAAVTGKVDVRE